MRKPDLHIVGPDEPTPADRIKRLQEEAARIAADETHAFAAALIALQLRAESIAAGGEAYLPGIRDMAARIARQAETDVNVIQGIIGRNGP